MDDTAALSWFCVAVPPSLSAGMQRERVPPNRRKKESSHNTEQFAGYNCNDAYYVAFLGGSFNMTNN